MMSHLEEAFRKSEEERQEAERRRQMAMTPIKAVEQLGEMFSGMLTGKALEQMQSVLNVIKTNIETKIELKEFNRNAQKIHEDLGTIMFHLKNIDSANATVARRITKFIDDLDSQLQLEREALTKLIDYLNNWL